MRIDRVKFKAFSLTELLIVLVIVAVLFAAMAPIITKRRTVQSYENESVWNYVLDDGDRNSYYNPGIYSWASSAYIGMNAPLNDAHPGKLVVNASEIGNDIQSQIQFRFGDGRGVNAGSLLLRSNSLFLGNEKLSAAPYYSVAAGLGAAKSSTSNQVVAFGANALENVNLNGGNWKLIAFGANAGKNYGTTGTSNGSTDNIFIGSNAGNLNSFSQKNIAIGYNAQGIENYSGARNVFIGANSGAGFASANSVLNTVVGSDFSGNLGYSTLIGYGAYNNGKNNESIITAIGYGACNGLNSSGNGNANTCIGYNSAGFSDTKSNVTYNNNSKHVYIGGSPLPIGGTSFGGKSVLEVHYTPGTPDKGSVVLNSNLAVRGDFYYGDGTNFHSVYYDSGSAQSYYRCVKDKYFKNLFEPGDLYSGYVCLRDSMNYYTSESANIMYSNSDIGSGYPDFIKSSDIRLKTDITPNNDGLDKLLALNYYNYTYKDDKTNDPKVGVIAQDLIKVFPNSVSKDEKGFYKIRWDEMFYALINSIKELNNKIVSVGEKISQIKHSLSEIKSDHKAVKAKISKINARINRLEKSNGEH